ncbi:MAG: hypothetical protein ACLS3Z_06085 [Faecalibacterium sp.]
MANLQKLNPTQQELYNYLEQQTGQVNFEVLQPFTTQEMGAVSAHQPQHGEPVPERVFQRGLDGQDQYPAGLLFPAGDAEPEI